MRTAAKLSLKRETLTELSTGELSSVVAGETTSTVISRIIEPCVTHDPPCHTITRVNDPCITDRCL